VEILYVMIPLGLVLVGFGLWAFFWATGSGQFDDLDSPGWTVLEDDARPPPDDEPRREEPKE
jgi:cbb3-type cytochrome oxidase maturation protein